MPAAIRALAAASLLILGAAGVRARSPRPPAPAYPPPPPPDDPVDKFDVSPEEALRFVRTIGGERALSDAIWKMGGNQAEKIDSATREAFVQALLKFRRSGDGPPTKYVTATRLSKVAEYLADRVGNTALFDWLCSPVAERELIMRSALRKEEYPILQWVVQNTDPDDYGGCYGQEFTFNVGQDLSEEEEDGMISAQLDAIFAVQIGKFELYCGEEGWLGKLEFGSRISGGKRLFEGRMLDQEMTFPSLQPWLTISDKLYFFGKKDHEMKSFGEELFVPMLAWRRNWVRSHGWLPRVVLFGFHHYEDQPVVRLMKVGFRDNYSYKTKTWCVGATTKTQVRRYAMHVALS